MNLFGQPPTVSQAEKELRPLLFDDGCQVLSTFEMNKIASLTYGELVCDEIFELFETVVAEPLNYSPLTVQKSLVVMKHVLIYGSEKCVNSGYGIAKFVESLVTFNTVLATQQKQGATAFLYRLKGGGVDKGGPVREAAKEVHELLKNINELQRIRNESASKNSLVPIGDDKVAFITDDVRHWILQKRIEQQAQIEIKSNLAKSEGGFGGGYMTNDGKSVVGAAHGIEEMIKMAKQKKQGFTDDGISGPSKEDRILADLAAEARRQKEEAGREAAARNEEQLGTFSGNPTSNPSEVDLLDFGSVVQNVPVQAHSSTTADLLGVFGGGGSASDDLLGLGGSNQMQQQQQQHGSLLDLAPWNAGGNGQGNELLSLTTTISATDPFSSIAASAQTNTSTSSLPCTHTENGIGGLSGMMNTLAVGPSTTAPVAAVEDRFAALDALASTNLQSTSSTALDIKMAENRILAGGSSSSTSSNSLASNIMGGGSIPLNHPTSPLPSFMPILPPPVDEPSSFPMGFVPSPVEAFVAPGVGHVAAAYGDIGAADDDDENPWVMGGTSGSGLEPLSSAPAAPPPPPPPGQ